MHISHIKRTTNFRLGWHRWIYFFAFLFFLRTISFATIAHSHHHAVMDTFIVNRRSQNSKSSPSTILATWLKADNKVWLSRSTRNLLLDFRIEYFYPSPFEFSILEKPWIDSRYWHETPKETPLVTINTYLQMPKYPSKQVLNLSIYFPSQFHI